MGIVSLTVDVAGQVGNLIGGVAPRRVAMVTSDSLSTITTAGYLNNVQREFATAFQPTDVISCWYSYSSNTSPGTFSSFTLSIVNGVITMVQNAALNFASVILNQSAVQNMYATPFQIVAAPGSGLIVLPVLMTLYTNFQTTAFAGGGVGILQWGNTDHGGGTDSLSATIPAAEITATASQIYSLPGVTASALTGVSNLGLFLSNQTGAFTGGSTSSTLVVDLLYQVIAASV